MGDHVLGEGLRFEFSDLVFIRNKEEYQMFEVLQLDIQLPPGTRFAATCQVKDVMMRVLLKCSADANDRLAMFKTTGGLAVDGKVNFKHGCYRPNFLASGPQAGFLDSVTHLATGVELWPSDKIKKRIDIEIGW